jgi:hypothetical protein
MEVSALGEHASSSSKYLLDLAARAAGAQKLP